jgi:hypothetical protein
VIPVLDVDGQEQTGHNDADQSNRTHGTQQEVINILELANDDGSVQRRIPVWNFREILFKFLEV